LTCQLNNLDAESNLFNSHEIFENITED